MHFSLRPMLLYGLILFVAIVSGMENENKSIAPNMIQIMGITGINSKINGIYVKSDVLHNKRVYYHKQYNSKYIYWERDVWFISNMLGKDKYNAYLHEDILFPTLASNSWILYDVTKNEFNEDKNMVVQKIEEKEVKTAPCAIQIKRITGINKKINGFYFKHNEPHNKRVYYHTETNSKYIYWDCDVWRISDMLGKNTYNAYLDEDILFPTLATKHWIAYDGAKKEFNEDNNIVLEIMNEKYSLCMFPSTNFKSIEHTKINPNNQLDSIPIIGNITTIAELNDGQLYSINNAQTENTKYLSNVLNEKQNPIDEHRYLNVYLGLKQDDEKIVKSLLNDFNKEEKDKLIVYLIKKEDECKNTILHHASENKHEETIKLILNNIFLNEEEYHQQKLISFILKENQYKRTSLSFALQNGNEKIVKLLLNAFSGEDTNEKLLIEYLMQENKFKYTFLHYASYYGHKEIVKCLLDAFAGEQNKPLLFEYVMKEDIFKETSLHYASKQGNEETIMLLLNIFSEETEKLIEYLMKKNQYKETALHYVSKRGDEKIVKLLLNGFGKGEKEKLFEYLMTEDKFKNTALHNTLEYGGNIKIAQLLLNVFIGTENEKFLIEYLMKENKHKNTVLHRASEKGYVEIVKLFLNAFSEDQNENLIKYLMNENYKKQTSSQLASKNGHKNITKMLSQKLTNAKN